jgi:hypothetical protein
MPTLAECGLKEVARILPGDFSASLYLEGGPQVAFVISRKPPVSKVPEINGQLTIREDDELTVDQLAIIRHWYDCNLAFARL